MGLTYELVDFRDETLLGQINIREKLIQINTSLDPTLNLSQEGRYNFTLGHEMGHWILHKQYVESEADMGEEDEPIILCRATERARIEIQADIFSSCLLMPRDKLIKEFIELTDRPNGICSQILATGIKMQRKLMDELYPQGSRLPSDEAVLGRFFNKLSRDFRVSNQAMIIRLKKLGLLT